MSRKPKHLTRARYQPKRLAKKPPLADRLRAHTARLKTNLKSKLPKKRTPKRLMKKVPRPQITSALIRYKIERKLAALDWRRIWRLSMATWVLILLTVVLVKIDFSGRTNDTARQPAPSLAASHVAYMMPLPDFQEQLEQTKIVPLIENPVPIATIGQTAVYAASSTTVTEADLERLRAFYAEDTDSEPAPDDETATTAEATLAEDNATEVDTEAEDIEPPEWATGDRQSEPPVRVNPETGMTYDDYYALFTPRVRGFFCRAGWGEADGIKSNCEVAMCYCVIFNRKDVGAFGDTFEEIITRPNQFTGYRASNPVTERHEQLLEVIIDQWIRMQLGETPDEVGWPIPRDILYWHANKEGTHNLFYKFENFNSGARIYFDYSQPLHNPYDV